MPGVRYQESLAIAQRLAAAEPDRADYQRELTVSYDQGGGPNGSGWNGDDARRLSRALGLRRGLAAAEPDRADYQRDLSVSYSGWRA